MRQTLKSSAPAGLFWVGLLKKRGADTTRMATESADPFPCRGLEGGGVKQMKPAGRQRVSFEFSAEGQALELILSQNIIKLQTTD
ncbi:hypothetical protein, partial [Duncaniella muris]|uniref:hypothetical protein n=1 Tax=Duncaniella muris TaxID=2094150 RepID=UPI002711FE07